MGEQVRMHEAVLASLLAGFTDSGHVRLTVDGESLMVSDSKNRQRVFGSCFSEVEEPATAVLEGPEVRKIYNYLDGRYGEAVLDINEDTVRVGGVVVEAAGEERRDAHPGREAAFRLPKERLVKEVKAVPEELAVLSFIGSGMVVSGFSSFLYTDRDVAANNVAVVSVIELLRRLAEIEGPVVWLTVRDDGMLTVEGGGETGEICADREIIQQGGK